MSVARHILAIEISNPGAGVRDDRASARSGPSVAFGRFDGVSVHLIDREWLRPTPAGSRGGIDDDLMPALDRLFARIGTPARKMLGDGRVAVSIGPGGYTSVRIACAAGKMIAEAAGARAVAVPTDAALAHAARRGNSMTGSLAVALAGKGDTCWIRLHTFGQIVPDQPGRLIGADDVPDLHARGVTAIIADAHLPRDVRSTAEGHGIRIIEPTYDAAAVMELGGLLPEIDPVELNPLYPREPDAVTQWRTRTRP